MKTSHVCKISNLNFRRKDHKIPLDFFIRNFYAKPQLHKMRCSFALPRLVYDDHDDDLDDESELRMMMKKKVQV